MSELSDSEYEIDDLEQAWNIGRSSVLAYLAERNEKLKAPGSLWAEYSMLKSTIFLNDSIDISKLFSTLIGFLKKKNVGYRAKKANVFTKEEFTRFLLEAPDEKFLVHKVGMIVGIAGGCRRSELYNLTIEDIEKGDGLTIVKLLETKTHIQRSFVVINKSDVYYLDIYHKHTNLRPKNAKSSHLFLNFCNGKCSNQIIGKDTIGGWMRKIAEYLKLDNPAGYTGHSFRRTSATLLANKGDDLLGIKWHGGWKSSSIAEGYIADSVESKIKFAKKILHGDENQHLSTPSTSVCTAEDNENLIYDNVDSINARTSPQSHSNEDRLQESYEFRDDANNLSSTPVLQNKLPLTIGNCNNCTFNIYVNK